MNNDTGPDCDYAGNHSYPSPKGKEPMRPYGWHSESNENRQLTVPVVAKKDNDDDEAGDADRDAFLEVDSEDDGDIPTTDGGNFNLDFIFQRMNEISLEEIDKMNQLDHDKAIRDLIDGNLSSIEENSLFLSAERIEGGLKHVSKNHDVEHAITNDPEIRQSIERYRKHGGDILRNLTELMLAAGSRNNVPVETQGWLLLLMANATKDCRERIIAALTNPSINPACIQYASGQQSWGPDMFDTAPKINLADPSACGDAVTAYMVIGLLLGRRFAYSGSATNTNAAQKDIGETSRMKVHSRILGLGHEEVLRRRRVGDTRVFKVHELLSKMEDHDYSFFLTVRIPVDVNDPDHLVSSTLVLLAEIINMVLFDTRSSDPVPRKGRAMVFIDQTNRLMKRLRPKDCPVAPWEGMNRVIPVLQMPKAVWGLLRQGHQQSSLPELMSRLREHFKKTRSLSLDRSLGAEMLKSVDRPSDKKNVRIVRRLYATILNENGLAYKSAYQEFLYMRCVLWHSIIVVAEKGLVSSKDGKYHLETNALDWVEVSRVARSIAPDALGESFSRTKCLELYDDRESAYFNQQVVFPMVWEKLRDGVPTKYAYAKARHYLPSPIRTRTRDICKYMLMQQKNSIVHGKTVVSTDEKHVSSLETLRKRVLEQLEKDLSLSKRVEVREGTWEDIAFLDYISQHIRLAHRDLQKGISPEEANDWGNLKALQPSWVLTSAQGPDIEYLPESVIAEAVDPMLLPALSDTPKHIIERMTFLQHKQAEFEPFSNAENRLGPKSGPGPEGTTEPFDLGDGRGITLRTRTFSVESESESEEETSGVEQTATNSGICDHCGVYHNDLLKHTSRCYGRCLECDQDSKACIRGAEDPLRCLPCSTKGRKCSGVSQESNVDPDQTRVECPRCWGAFVLSNMVEHVSACRGRCSSCVGKGLPCIRLTSNDQQCQSCENADQCMSFSHDHLVLAAAPGTCEKCLGPITFQGHQYECPGQCKICHEAQIPCIRSARWPAECDHCKEKGLACGGYTHEENLRERGKVACPRCLRDDVWSNHLKKCKGRCKGCVRAGIPCVRGRGYGNKCKSCATVEECGDYDYDDDVPKSNCKSCGVEHANHLLKNHEKGCKGKCSHCEEVGAACERQGRSVSEPCGRCAHDGVGDSCDGWWKK